MKDRRLVAFGLMLDKRRRLDQTLRETLVAQRAELEEAENFAQQQRASLDEARSVLNGCDDRVEAMLSGREAMSLPVFNQLREYRVVLVERVTAAEAEVKKAQAQVARCSEAVDDTRAQIVRNEGQIGVIEKRIEKIKIDAERAQEDLQDEEIEEIMVARAIRIRGEVAEEAA
jgi:type III secretion system HrpB7-like protein